VKSRQVSLPLSRVRLIMKSSPDVANISQEALYLITLSTELFVENLGMMALKNRPGSIKVDYKDLAKVVDERPTLDFLKDIIPRKITAKEYKEILNNEEEINEDDYL